MAHLHIPKINHTCSFPPLAILTTMLLPLDEQSKVWLPYFVFISPFPGKKQYLEVFPVIAIKKNNMRNNG